MPYPTLVWVTVAGVQHSRRRWTYTLTEDNPGRLNDGTSGDRPIPPDMLCCSYPELFDWLYLYGFTPPTPGLLRPHSSGAGRGSGGDSSSRDDAHTLTHQPSQTPSISSTLLLSWQTERQPFPQPSLDTSQRTALPGTAMT